MKGLSQWLGDLIKIVSFFAVSALVMGFLIWNLYLVRLGFYEFNIFQARYIHAGIPFLFVAPPVVALLLLLLRYLLVRVPRISKDVRSGIMIYLGAIFFVLLTILYAFLIFPSFSQAFGGAQPRVLSVIASEQDIDYLASFGIQKSSPIITENLCVAYENQETIIILREDRVLMIKKDDFRGFNSLPAKTRDEAANYCSELAKRWVLNQKVWNVPTQQ